MEPVTNLAGAVFGQVPSTAEEACGPRPADTGRAISTLMPPEERQAREKRFRDWETCRAGFEADRAKQAREACGPQPVFPPPEEFERMFFADQMALVKAGSDWKACIEGKAKAPAPDSAPSPEEEQGKPAHCRVPFFRLQQMSPEGRAVFEDECRSDDNPKSETTERCGYPPVFSPEQMEGGISAEEQGLFREALEGWLKCARAYALTFLERQDLDQQGDARSLVERERQRVCGQRPRPGAYGQLSVAQYFEDVASWKACIGSPGEKPTKEAAADECKVGRNEVDAMPSEEKQAWEKICGEALRGWNPYL